MTPDARLGNQATSSITSCALLVDGVSTDHKIISAIKPSNKTDNSPPSLILTVRTHKNCLRHSLFNHTDTLRTGKWRRYVSSCITLGLLEMPGHDKITRHGCSDALASDLPQLGGSSSLSGMCVRARYNPTTCARGNSLSWKRLPYQR